MNRFALPLLSVSVVLLAGCGETDPDAPPEILLGDSVCIECGMIVSDERFGTATIIEGDRGSQVLVFDDFNCQRNYERSHPELGVITRWSRDYQSLAWFHTENGYLVQSAAIRTPMASNVAAFVTREDAEAFATSTTGEVIRYDTYLPPSEP